MSALKGQIPWNKGIHTRLSRAVCSVCGHAYQYYRSKGVGRACSLACRRKLPIPHLTKHRFKSGVVPWNKHKRVSQYAGANHWNWQGGKTAEHDRARKSIEYKLWRLAVFTRDDYTCQFCQKRGVKLQADHIKPWALYPSLRFAIDNGRTLCVDCHKETDTYLNGFGHNQYTKVGALRNGME